MCRLCVVDTGDKIVPWYRWYRSEITKKPKIDNNTAKKVFTGVNDTTDKFFTGVVDTGDKTDNISLPRPWKLSKNWSASVKFTHKLLTKYDENA